MTRKRSIRKKPSRVRKQAGRFTRFLRAFIASAVTTFGIASCVLNPQLHEQISLEPILSQLGLPGQAEAAPQVVVSGP